MIVSGHALYSMTHTLGRQEPDDEFLLHLHFSGSQQPRQQEESEGNTAVESLAAAQAQS